MEPENKKEPTVVKTYAEDLAESLQSGAGGMIKKIIHGEEEHEKERKNLSPESAKNKFFMTIGMLFILGALVTLMFFLPSGEATTVPADRQFTPLIFNDRVTLVEVGGIKKDKIPEKVLSELGKLTIKNGGVGGAYLTVNKSPVGLRKFIEIIEGNFVPGATSVVSDNFLMGVIKNDKKEPQVALSPNLADRDFFILLKIHSLADVFGPIHAWENKMFQDLHGFFGIPLSPETKYLLTKDFADGIVENKNARILYDNVPLAEGETEFDHIVMMYIMVDDESIIITSSEHATEEIIARLASGRIKK